MRSPWQTLAVLVTAGALALGLAGPAAASSQAELEQRIKLLEKSLNELKDQLGQMQATQAQQQEQVATVMGSAFGAEGYVRLSFAASMDSLEEGFDRLARFLASAS